jgi:nucleoside 2-deoxyribosyltransferase
MKYYFTGSTKHLEEDSFRYQLIFNQLKLLDFSALNYVHLPKNDPEKIKRGRQLANQKVHVYELQTSLIDQADILIADITRESTTVGYQIDYAIRKKIPVLVLANQKNEHAIPVMLTSNHYGLLTVKKYQTEEDIKQILTEYSQSVISGQIKFNLFLNIPIYNYLVKRAAKEKKSRSEVLRMIVSEEIKRNPY